MVSFPIPLTTKQARAYATQVAANGGRVLQWSPTNSFARIRMQDEFDTCAVEEGSGNPLLSLVGHGQEISLNYIVGTTAYANPGDAEECFPLRPAAARAAALATYSPTRLCSDDGELVPKTGGRSVGLAIIDSGIKGARSRGTIHGVSYRQTVLPKNCDQGNCNPVTRGIERLSPGVPLPWSIYIQLDSRLVPYPHLARAAVGIRLPRARY